MSRLTSITLEQRTRLSKNIAKAQAPSRPLIRWDNSAFKLLDGTVVDHTDYLACVEACEVV